MVGRSSSKLVSHRPQKKTNDSADKSTTESTSTSVFLRTTFRDSAITPASPLIRKSTTLRSTLWCSYYSVAKRQQFSCPLGIATVSLKLENVVPGRWVCSFSYCGQVFFFICSSSIVRTRIFGKISYDVTFFSSSTILKHKAFFCPHFFAFEVSSRLRRRRP